MNMVIKKIVIMAILVMGSAGAVPCSAAVRHVGDPQMGLQGRWGAQDNALVIAHLMREFAKNKRIKHYDRVLVWEITDLTGDPVNTKQLRVQLQKSLQEKFPRRRFMLKGIANLILTAHIELHAKRIDSYVRKKYTIWLRAHGTTRPTRQVWSKKIVINRTVPIAHSHIGSP